MHALEPSLSVVNKHVRLALATATSSYRAEWLQRRAPASSRDGFQLNAMLRYGICTAEMLYEHLLPRARADWVARHSWRPSVEIPRRLYRAGKSRDEWWPDREVVQALLELRGPDGVREPDFGRSIASLLRRVIEAGDMVLARKLCGRTEAQGLASCLPAAIETGDFDLVKRVIHGYGGPAAPCNWPPIRCEPSDKDLQLAIDRGHLPIVNLLISLGTSGIRRSLLMRPGARPKMAHLRRLGQA